MVPSRVRRLGSEKLERIVSSNYLLEKAVLRLYGKYKNLRNSREFHSRIARLNPDDYLDVSGKPRLNLVVLVIDCLPNSRLSSQGYSRETTPFLDSVGHRFSAISASCWTYPSVASILTGVYPHNHGAVIAGQVKNFDDLENFQRLRADILTLPEMFFLLGYRTYFGTAIDPAFYPLRTRVIPERYDDPARAQDVLNGLVKWILKSTERFFAYVHLGDLHQPLHPPDDFKAFFGPVEDLPNIGNWDFRRPEQQKGDSVAFQQYKENRGLLYDNTLRYVDHAIEQFYDVLQRRGLIDSTILVITADHGEEFWEHADMEARYFYDPRGCYGVGHGHNVFNETIEVPMILSGPIPAGERAHLVSGVDIVPTVVDLLGLNHRMTFDGKPITETNRERPLLSEASGYGHEKKALIVGRYKLVYSKDDGVEWLFDLIEDPEERRPIADRHLTSAFVERLLRMLREDDRRRIRQLARKKGLSKAQDTEGDRSEA